MEPTSVHNAYVQVAAELGLIGVVLLVLMLCTLAVDIRRVIRRAEPGSAARRLLWFLAFGVVLIVVWLNDNPLFGGQAETVLLAVLIGLIGALGAQLAGRPEGQAGDATSP